MEEEKVLVVAWKNQHKGSSTHSVVSLVVIT